MPHDGEYFREREAQARAAAFCRDSDEVEIAGQLALAYSALARRHRASADKAAPAAAEEELDA